MLIGHYFLHVNLGPPKLLSACQSVRMPEQIIKYVSCTDHSAFIYRKGRWLLK